MRTVLIGAKIGRQRSADGRDHHGRRSIHLPETLEEIPAWNREVRKLARDLRLSLTLAPALDCIERGYIISHQRDMRDKMLAKVREQVLQAQQAKPRRRGRRK